MSLNFVILKKLQLHSSYRANNLNGEKVAAKMSFNFPNLSEAELEQLHLNLEDKDFLSNYVYTSHTMAVLEKQFYMIHSIHLFIFLISNIYKIV